MNRAFVETLATPDGPFTVISTLGGEVISAGWTASVESLIARLHHELHPTDLVEKDTPVGQAVEAYYRGDWDAVTDVPILYRATEFQDVTWQTMRRIPAGETWTYAQLAQASGRPSAVRAVASVCARNASALFIPCHRIVRTNGGIGKFAWGTQVKESLLARETGH